MANSGPPPARLCAISDLGERGVGEKVRVLGCITNYNTTTALLTLHPPHSPSPSSTTSTSKVTTKHNHTAQIDLHLLLSSTPPPVTAIGEWVNVIGYITSQQSAPSAPPTSAAPPTGRGERGSQRRGGKEGGSDGEETKGEHHTSIQALLLWSAGGLNVQEYEEVIADLKAERESERDLKT